MAWFDKNTGGKKTETEPQSVAPASKPASEPTVTVAAPLPQPISNKADVPSPAAPAATSMASLVGYLYKGSRVTGQLSFQGPARIDGIVDGEVHCQGILTVGEGAELKAKITGQIVVIRGKVEGNVTAKERIELLAPARLIGNIDAPRLIIAEGVVFDGDCSMGVAKQKVGVAGSHGQSADKAAAASAPKL
jgi:cytoskeletal protein CcmA (bactofilin family)